MQRRKYLAAIGSLAAGGAAAMGTGAFTSVSAERQVSVDVVADQNAYLGLEAVDERVSNGNDGGELAIDFAGSSEGANGLNPDSRTAFTDLFKVKNLGENDAVIAVGTSRSNTWTDPDNLNGGPAPDLLFDQSGLSGFVYTEEQARGDYGNSGGAITAGGGTGLGPTGGFGSIQIDTGGRVDANFSNQTLTDKRTIEPGEYLNVDMSIITSEDPPYFDGNTSIVVLAAEPGSDRDFSN